MMVIAIENGSSREAGHFLDQMFALRAKVFNDRLGWQVVTRDGRERDQFDELEPVYILAVTAKNDVVGCARLLPATGQTMLMSVFPQLVSAPSFSPHPQMVERSRFCVDTTIQSTVPGGLHHVTRLMFAGILEWCLSHGHTEVVTVTDIAVERILGRTWDTVLAGSFRDSTVKPARYAYVSLFGLESLADVRRALFENTVEAAAFKESGPLEATTESVTNRLSQFASKWRAGAGILRGMPVIADYSSLVEKAGFLDVRNQIVCFDDLERMSNGLALKDVLGLVSFLKEKKKCKVVLLLNSEALKDHGRKDFEVQLEKVIDINLVFDPTPQEAAAIAVPDRSGVPENWIAQYTVTLGISNIRTIHKLRRIAARLRETLRHHDERIYRKAVHSACLYGFALYQPEDAPPLTMLLEERPYAYLFGEKEKSPEEIRWTELISRYQYHHADRFDIAVYEAIKTGFYDAPELKEQADNLTQNLAVQDQDKAFSDVWDLYHGSFDDNEEEFAIALKKSVVENAPAISPANLSASISLLKELGYTEGLDGIINGYVAARNDGKDFWLGDRFTTGHHVEDPDVAAAFTEKAKEFGDDRRLLDVLTSMMRNRGWDGDAPEFIDSFSADDYRKMMKSTRGDELQQLVYGLLYFRKITNPDETMQSITAKAIDALQNIAAESPINRTRVAKFGVSLPVG
ncbi:GNAT family N-acetyltransferase [Ensifer sp. ENS09]|uniref:acyl-homoserine-lactone synthase n=1 Tax=Ensifer sp. ENS09 TaxID=2769263 RepID=UPI001787060C|nr:acyl-homoserine-lactone synthase [Ensifer sp. ENS09]MBD9653167.1 GNAT family N-acetyltransferase [Ensifer sp. ENS09]